MQKSTKQIHIVAFDIPYPANYGGVIDIFHKVQALHKEGVEVTLHMYQYGRKKHSEVLKKFCKKLYYYKRRTFKNPFIGSKPYIVNSRNGEEILNNLCKDRNPILFEGLHCTFHLASRRLEGRFKIVRTHNVEHHYYKHLEKSEISYFKKYFFRLEAEKLRKYESILKHASLIAAISPNDKRHFSKKYKNVIYLPAFHSCNTMTYPGKRGDFILYHGNLAVPENYQAAIDLVKKVFSKVNVKCVIAGNNPPKDLINLCKQYSNVEIRYNITTEEIHNLIEDAHLNVLYTNQNTGIKLKLLNALYRGKFAIVNPKMVDGSGLEKVCTICKDFDAMLEKVKEYMLLDYSESYFENRKKLVEENFGNENGAKTLIDSIDFTSESLPKRKSESLPKRKSDSLGGKSLSHISSLLSYFYL